MGQLKISSPVFSNNQNIPVKYTCDGENVNPPLTIQDVPPGTKSLSLMVEDPDAPSGLWVHWMVWNINPRMVEIPENSVPREAVLGRNDSHRNSYGGPCPPSGSHRYTFRLYALDTVLDLAGGASRNQLKEAMDGHVIDEAEVTGLYGRVGHA